MSWQQQQGYRKRGSGAYGQPVQPAQAPPSYSKYHAQNIHHGAMHKPAIQRRKSEFKSLYPLTKWCATYINTQSSSPSGDWADDKVDLSSPIPSTNCYLPMDLEENIMAEIQMYIDEEKELTARLEKAKLEVDEKRDKEEQERKDKIDTFMNFTEIKDRETARNLLAADNWDLEKATQKQFGSSPDVLKHPAHGHGLVEGQSIDMGPGGGYGAPVKKSNGGGGAPMGKTVIRIILPDNRQYTYQMDAHDTFWAVYGRLLTSVPELNQKPFNLELKGSGHELKESEFDQTLSHASLVPNGEILIKY